MVQNWDDNLGFSVIRFFQMTHPTLRDTENSRECQQVNIVQFWAIWVYQFYFKFLLHEKKMVELNTEEHKKSGEAENSFLGLMYGQYMLPDGIADVWAFQKLLGRDENIPCETGFIQYILVNTFSGKNK